MENKADVQLYGTSDLCFDKDVFMRPDFNVDDFMREYNQLNGNTNLEMLRDHLGVYLKVLRSAMIDLINRDYADFVNLSTNLTGIDSLIQTLTVPLEQLREEVLSVSQMLETASSGVMSDLQKQDAVLKYKKKLSTLSIIAKRLDNFEDLISHLSLDSESPMQQKTETKPEISSNAASTSAPWTGNPETPTTEVTTSQNLCAEVCSQEELLHRLAAELSHLNYLGSTCEGTHLMSIYKPRIERIQSAVEACIESNFRTALGGDFCRGSTTSCNITLLKHTLVACTVLGRPGVVQRVLRDILSPLIQQTVSDESLRSNPRGLTGVLSSLLSQLKTCLAPLLALTVPRKHHSSCSAEEVPGLQFVERSVFPEVVTALSSLTDFFSPANPSLFHQRYSQCLELLDALELMLVTRERVVQFRAMEEYQKFLDLWNLAVYFQIRNQEIRQVVESSLCEEAGVKLLSRDVSGGEGGGGGMLCSTRGVMRGTQQCWLPEVYLPPLLHRFWKLTLLILSRHRTWITHAINEIKSGGGDLLALNPKPGMGSCRPTSVVHLCVALLSDIRVLCGHITALYDQHIAQHTQHLEHKHSTMIINALKGESELLLTFEATLVQLICDDVITAVTTALQPVTATPRLYRRTNREVPTKPQPYVSGAAAPVLQLQQLAQHCVAAPLLRSCYVTITAAVAKQYSTLTSEVLDNVSKTEESLRRLKRARGTAAVTAPQGHSDEDKIREQLHLDVQHFAMQLSSAFSEAASVEEFVQLSSAVAAARTAASDTTS